MEKKQEEALDAALEAQGIKSDANKKAVKEMWDYIGQIHQGDKLFLRNQLGFKFDPENTDDFLLAVAAWKKRGGGMTEWNFVLNMTDEQLSEELGFVEEDDDE